MSRLCEHSDLLGDVCSSPACIIVSVFTGVGIAARAEWTAEACSDHVFPAITVATEVQAVFENTGANARLSLWLTEWGVTVGSLNDSTTWPFSPVRAVGA
jgi:hypothetical protein